MFKGGEGETGILVMRNDEVFTIGSNEHGLLGVKGVAASPIPTKIKEISGKGVKGNVTFLRETLAVRCK